ncbi:MAG TPA: EAL domain-containing protein, partial [Trinickia sp.]|nr:EAL domain-containing protein [Trinickia sp.]
DPSSLIIEVTETALMRNADATAKRLRAIKDLGVRIAVDDFGTGYSSLGYLKRFPVDRLKIDRSFVSDIGASDDDETITSAIIALAHSLELQVIAEGVETSSQLDFLRERSCHEMQGFFFAKPMPRDAIPGLLQQGMATAEQEA